MDQLLSEINIKLSEEKDKIFDLKPYRPSAGITMLGSKVSESVQEIEQSNQNIVQLLENLIDKATSNYLKSQVEFWKLGRNFLEESKNIPLTNDQLISCPFCGENTVTKTVIERITNAINSQEKLAQMDELSFGLESYRQILIKLEETLRENRFVILSDQQQQKLRKVFAGTESRLEEFISKNQSNSNVLANLLNLVGGFINSIPNPESIANSEGSSQIISALREQPRQIMELLTDDMREDLNMYNPVYTSLSSRFEDVIVGEGKVEYYKNLMELLTAKLDINLVLLARQYESDILECQRIVDVYIRKKQEDILTISVF